jgi:hypothetical protein
MTFWRRVRTYLVGFGLGLLMVYVFFGDRDLSSWTPEGRILTTIDSSAMVLSERAICQIKCLELSDSLIYQIQETAEVNFSESSTRKEPCPIYKLESVWKEEKYKLIWEVCENAEEVTLISILKNEKNCAC